MGVASGTEVYRYPHNNNNFPYSTCISSFGGSSIPTSLFIFKMFFRSYIILYILYDTRNWYNNNYIIIYIYIAFN